MSPSVDNHGEHEPTRVELSEEEIEHVTRAALDHYATRLEWVFRYAAPEERNEVGLRIDPETARVFFIYAEVIDPYGDSGVPEEWSCIGRTFFAVDPHEGVAVEWSDLPETTREALEAERDVADREGWKCLALGNRPPLQEEET